MSRPRPHEETISHGSRSFKLRSSVTINNNDLVARTLLLTEPKQQPIAYWETDIYGNILVMLSKKSFRPYSTWLNRGILAVTDGIRNNSRETKHLHIKDILSSRANMSRASQNHNAARADLSAVLESKKEIPTIKTSVVQDKEGDPSESSSSSLLDPLNPLGQMFCAEELVCDDSFLDDWSSGLDSFSSW